MLPSLYQLTTDYSQLIELDTDDEINAALVEIVAGEIEHKAENICKLLAVVKASAEAFKAEEQRISVKRRALENKEAAIRRYVKDAMVAGGIDKIKAGTFSLSVGISPGALVIDNVEALPPEFIVIEKKPVNSAIKDAIKAGAKVPGAHIESDWQLRIK